MAKGLFAIRNSHLPLFPERADFQFKCPGAARLLVKLPVGRRNRRRRHQQVRVIKRLLTPEPLATRAHPGGVDAGIDDQVRDVDVFGSELARHRLRHRAQSKFGAGEGRITAAAAQGGGGAGEEYIALAARHHQPRRFAPGDKAGPAGHFPYFPEHAVGGLQDREVDVGADVEDADFERCLLVGVIKECRGLVLLSRVERARDDRSPGCLDLPDQRLQLGAVAPSREYGEALGGEFLGDLGADIVAGADYRGRCVAFLHFICSAPRHCEEQSDEAIDCEIKRQNGLLRFARNDGGGYLPETSSSTSRNCSLPKNISLPTKKVGEPNAPRSTASWVFVISFAFTSGAWARANSFAASRPDAAKAFMATSGSSIFFGSPHMWWNAASTYFSNTPSNCAATAARIRLRVLTGKNGFIV